MRSVKYLGHYAEKGAIPWNKGLRGAQVAWNKGIPMSEEAKQKMIAKKIGKKPWNYAGGKKCIDCGGLVKNRSKATKRCWSCAKKNYRGENVYNWVGGVVKRYADGEAFAIKKWAKSVYSKDHYTCAMCHKHCAKDIQAHHILSWKDAPELRLEINNGITLCFDCHLTTRGKEAYLAPLFYNVLATRQSDRFVWSNYTRD